MSRVFVLMAAVVALGFSTAAFAEPATPAATTPTPAAKPGKKPPSPDDMICEEDASVTGSILSHRVCMTRAQREAQTQQSQHDLQDNIRLGGRPPG